MLKLAASILIFITLFFSNLFPITFVSTTACSKILADFVPDHDATAVALLKEAGGIMMGKTVTTEFAMFDPPATKNPWNHTRTPGGSSSGSAAGTAAQTEAVNRAARCRRYLGARVPSRRPGD